MGTAKCFRCLKDYESNNPDDLEGDGRCDACKELGKKIAFKVDIDISNRRLHETPVKSRLREIFTEQEIIEGDVGKAMKTINMRDLGINPHG